jgi:hypothetical protein
MYDIWVLFHFLIVVRIALVFSSLTVRCLHVLCFIIHVWGSLSLFFVVLGIELRALCLLGRHPAPTMPQSTLFRSVDECLSSDLEFLKNFFGSTGVWTQDLTLAGQAQYLMSFCKMHCVTAHITPSYFHYIFFIHSSVGVFWLYGGVWI